MSELLQRMLTTDQLERVIWTDLRTVKYSINNKQNRKNSKELWFGNQWREDEIHGEQ